MSFAGPVNLLNLMVKEDFNIKLLKKHSVSQVKQKNILEKLAFMGTFKELSKWVEISSNGQKYIACPSTATEIDRDCCFSELQELILRAIKGQNDRKNGRDLKLTEATKIGDFATIAKVLASAAWTYWQDFGFALASSSSRINIATFSTIKNMQENQQKKQYQKAQIDHIGAAVDFKKALKKGAFQEILDFKETEEILKTFDDMVA